MTDEATFRQAVAAVIKGLGAQLDTLETDDLDWKLTDGVLTAEFESGGVFVLSQQVPTRELWLSAYSHAWHFDQRDGVWRERDTREPMEQVLGALFTRKLGLPVTLRV